MLTTANLADSKQPSTNNSQNL